MESLAAPSVCGAAGASPLGGEAGLVSEQHPVPPIATAELDRATGASGLSAELVEPKAGRSATSADQATEDLQNRVLAPRSEDQPARRSESGGAQRQLMQLAAAYIPPPPRNKPRPARSAFSPGPASLRLPLSATFSGVSAVRRALSRFFSRLCSRHAGEVPMRVIRASRSDASSRGSKGGLVELKPRSSGAAGPHKFTLVVASCPGPSADLRACPRERSAVGSAWWPGAGLGQ